MTDDDNWPVSRRQLLAGISSVGAAAATGAGTGSWLRDNHRTGARVTSGALDLEAAWVDGGSNVELGTVKTVGDGGSNSVILSLPEDSNPAFVWFRTRCKQCTDLEEKLAVSFTLVTDEGETTLFNRTRLRYLRQHLGSGERLNGRLLPGDNWRLVVEWELREPLQADAEVDFDLEFYATQARNVDDPATYGPAWSCPDDGCDAEGPRISDISWVGFCAESGATLRPSDVEFSVDGTVLDLTEAPDSLGTVLLKYGTKLDVFENPATDGTFEAGTAAEWYEQQGPNFPDSGRSNHTPCPGTCGLKYEIDGGDFETKGCDS